MPGHATRSSDRSLGLAVVLSLLTVAGGLVMYLNPDSAVAGWGFAFAMLAASLAVVAVHVYG